MKDQLGPWIIDPKNQDTRYLVVDNLYGEMRVIGGVKPVEPCRHSRLDGHELGYVGGRFWCHYNPMTGIYPDINYHECEHCWCPGAGIGGTE